MTHTTIVPMVEMIGLVEQYILMRKGVVVHIEPPTTNAELNKLGYAYDYAREWLMTNGYIVI